MIQLQIKIAHETVPVIAIHPNDMEQLSNRDLCITWSSVPIPRGQVMLMVARNHEDALKVLEETGIHFDHVIDNRAS